MGEAMNENKKLDECDMKDTEVLFEGLKKLYGEQVRAGTIEYVENHSNNDVIIKMHVDAYLRYRQHLNLGSVLDWGCLHGPDSCLMRMDGFGFAIEGCDVYLPDKFEIFHRFSGFNYSVLKHLYLLPYETGRFDSVIGSGVLEHVVNARESLKEIHRVMNVGARLILTFLPCEHSLTEFVLRKTGRPHHRRRFTPSSIEKLLIDCGFIPEKIEYHAATPTLTSPGFKLIQKSRILQTIVSMSYAVSPIVETLYPINRLGQNLMVIANRAEWV